MKLTRMFLTALVLVSVMTAGSLAVAKPVLPEARQARQTEQPAVPLPNAIRLADNVVVVPQATPQPGPQPSPEKVNVQPAAPAAQPTPVVDQPRKVVHTDVAPPRNYMSTIFVNALMGGLAGALVGGAIYYLDDQDRPINIAYWAAGGVLLGTGVGLTQLVVQENRASNATAMNRFSSDPVPTYRLALFRASF